MGDWRVELNVITGINPALVAVDGSASIPLVHYILRESDFTGIARASPFPVLVAMPPVLAEVPTLLAALPRVTSRSLYVTAGLIESVPKKREGDGLVSNILPLC
jgi:hypothetical protein